MDTGSPLYPASNSSAQAQRNSFSDFRSPGSSGQSPADYGQTPPMQLAAGSAGGNGYHDPLQRRNGAGAPQQSPYPFAREPPPPNAKNTSHVPCKFFRLGNCQAGKACPFSHALDTINDPAPCKYFAKGNCKYGYRCANPHILPDGRDGRKVNYGRRGHGSDGAAFNLGPPAHSGPFVDQHAGQAYPIMPPSSASSHPDHYGTAAKDHYSPHVQQRTLDNLPTIDSAYSTHRTMQYGSPPHEGRQPMSPPIRAMDTALPSSFDSNGMSNLARYGPMGSSVPSRFGFGPSSPTTSTATSNAFANLNYMARGPANGSRNGPYLGMSPSTSTNVEPSFAKRLLHSERQTQPQNIASSLPVPRPMMRKNHIDDSEDDSDEDKVNFLPGALSDDIMTPQEKMRRFSRHDEDNGLSARSLSGVGSPQDSKVGSPSNGSPASRWGALFARRQQQQQLQHQHQYPHYQQYHRDDGFGGLSTDFNSSSPYGVVGSPLRNSSILNDTSPSIKAVTGGPGNLPRSGDVSPFGMSSPPTTTTSSSRHPTNLTTTPSTASTTVTGGGVGMLSQQLKNTRLRESTTTNEASTLLPQTGIRAVSGGSSSAASSSAAAAGAGRLDRAVSSSSVARSDRIDEEPYLFEMDEEDVARHKEQLKLREREKELQLQQKRLSGGVLANGGPWNFSAAAGATALGGGEGSSTSSPGGGLGAIGAQRGAPFSSSPAAAAAGAASSNAAAPSVPANAATAAATAAKDALSPR